MSSRSRRQGGCDPMTCEFVGRQSAKDLVAEASTEGPDRLGLRVAGGHSLGEVHASRALALKLGDGDPVEGDVELAIAAAVQPMADRIARPDRDWSRAVV